MITGLVGEGYNVLGGLWDNQAVIWDIENDTATQMDWPYDTTTGPRIETGFAGASAYLFTFHA